MSEIASAYVRIRPEMSGFKQETEKGVKHGMSGIGKLVAGLGAGLVVSSAIKAGFKELGEAAKVTAQTNAVIKSTGDVSKVTAAEVTGLANAMLAKTGIDDEAIQVSENMLLTFTNIRNEVGKNNDIFTQSAKAVLDMDTAMTHGNTTAESLRGTSILVGKALNDPVKGMTALRRVGVSLDEAQQKTVKSLVAQGKTLQAQKLILHELNREFGGSAEAIGKTLPGKLNILKQTFKNDMAQLLSGSVPTMTKLLDWAGVAMPVAFRGLGIIIRAVIGEIKNAFSLLSPVLQPIINEVKAFTETWQKLGSGGAFDQLKANLEGMSAPAKVAAAAIAGVGAAILLMTAPITSLVAVGVALDVLYHKNKAFRDAVNQAWTEIKTIVAGVTSYLQNLWAQYGATIVADARRVYALLAQIVSQALDWIKGFWQRNGQEISQYARTALDDVKTIIRTALAIIRGYWDRFGAETIAILKAQWNQIKGTIQGAIQVIKNIIKLALDLIHGNWSAAWHDLVGIVQGVLKIITSVLRGYVTIVANLAKGIGKAIIAGIIASTLGIGAFVVNALKGIGTAIVAAAKSAYHFALDIGKQIVDGILDGVKSLPGRLGSALKSGIGGAFSAGKSFLISHSPSKRAAKELGEPIAAGIIEGFLGGINGLKPAMTKSVGSAIQGTSAAVKSLSAGTQASISAIVQAAQRYGVDPAAMIAIAMHESGLRAGAVGDQGSSFGLFQLHKGGALGSMSPSSALDALTNALVAAKALAGLGGRGLHGSAAVSLLSRGFERPADPAGEIADAMSHYQEALSYVGSTSRTIVKAMGAAAMSATDLIRMQPAILRDRKLGTSLLPSIGATIGDLAKKAAATNNIGAGAEAYLEQERTLLEIAYQTLKADLAHTKGKARAQIEAAMETIHRKIGVVIDAIADAVIVTGDALIPDKLRAQLRGLNARFKAVTDLASVKTGDELVRYQTFLEGNLVDQRNVLMHEVDSLKAQLSAAKGRQKAAIAAELAKVRGQLSNVNDQVLQALEGLVQAAQGRVSTIFGRIRSAMDAQFEAATQKMLDELGKKFFQGTLTPEEAALQAYQTTKNQAALQAALIQAQGDLASALSQPLIDPADIATKRAALTAAQEAIRVDKMQTAATESRTRADQEYAKQAAKLQADRQALEQKMNDQLDALIESVLNGTGSISELKAIADKYGITIDTESIPQMKDLAAATRTLAYEFKKLEALIRKLTGRTGVVDQPSSDISQATAFGNVLNNAFKNAINGSTGVHGLATGGYVPPRRGGTIIRVGEGGEGEFITPESRVASHRARGTRDVIDALGPLSTLDRIARTNQKMLDELRAQTVALNRPAPTPMPPDSGNVAAMRAIR